MDESDKARLCVDESDKARLCMDESDKARLCMDESDKARLCVDESDKARLCVDESDKARLYRSSLGNILLHLKRLLHGHRKLGIQLRIDPSIFCKRHLQSKIAHEKSSIPRIQNKNVATENRCWGLPAAHWLPVLLWMRKWSVPAARTAG
jgi:hypothetical protein